MKTTIFSKIIGLMALVGLVGPAALVSSCSDEPDSENFYSFTGEMMSDYLKNRTEYSDFYAIVDKAGLTDLLSTYGHYTCFVPNNEAVAAYLSKKGKSSVGDLSVADCDTIARTHLVGNMYTTMEMNSDRLATTNMLGRVIATSQGFDADSNAVVILEGTARIYYDLKDDSVENGIMQPIDMVIEKSNSYLTDIVESNSKISTYFAALKATGLLDELMLVEDETWDPKSHNKYYYTSDFWKEVAWVPDTKKYGFTFFAVPDSILTAKYGIAKGDVQALYNKACEIYDPVYPKDVNAEGHSFANLTDSVNPLRRFMQYHLLNKRVGGTAHALVQQVILHEAAKGIHRVGEVGKAMTLGVDILGINRVVDFAGFVVEGLDVALGNAILGRQDAVGHGEECEAILLGVGHPGYLLPEVRGVVILVVALGVPGFVFHEHQLVEQARGLQGSKVGTDLGVALHDVGQVTVRLLYHHVDGLHDTVLHGVVLQVVVDTCRTFEYHHGVAVGVEALRGGDDAAQHVGGSQTVGVHLHRGIHIAHEVGPSNGVAVGHREVADAALAFLRQIGSHSLIVGHEAGIVAIGREQVGKSGLVDNGIEVAILRAVLQVVAHHLARERVEVLAVGLVGTAAHESGGADQSHKGHETYNLAKDGCFHIIVLLSVSSSSHSCCFRRC